MKRTLLLSFFICLIVTNAGAAQQDPKQALKIIRLAYEAWNKSNDECMQADSYLTAPDGKILGQRFYTFSGDEKFVTIMLTWDGPAITGAMQRDSKIELQWNNDRVSNVKVKDLYLFDYAVHYNDIGEVTDFTYNELFNKRVQFVRAIELDADRITKVTAYENDVPSSKPWIRSVKTYTYGNDETTVNFQVYTTNKPNKPENISSNGTGGRKKIDNSRFVTAAAWGDNIEAVYNENNKISAKKVVRHSGKTEDHSYTWLDGKIFKEETVTIDKNGVYEKRIDIAFALSDKPASTPDWEKTPGIYKFNKDGDLVWEARDSKCREKANGVWSDWKFFRM